MRGWHHLGLASRFDPSPNQPCADPLPLPLLPCSFFCFPPQALAEAGKLASLTVAQLSKYLSLHGLPTGGKKAEVVARVAQHAQQA